MIILLFLCASASIRELSDDPVILLDDQFVSPRAARMLEKAAKRMGYDDHQHRVFPHTFLPIDQPYEPKKYSVIFEPDYSDEALETIRTFEEHVGNWTKIPYSEEEKPMMVSRLSGHFGRMEDPHLDSHLEAHRVKTVVAFLTTSHESKLIFPCIETDDMSAREWRERNKICERSFRHLRAAHEKLQRDLDIGLDLKKGEHYNYLMENTHLAAFAEVFTKHEETGLRNWNWSWGRDEEDNLWEHHKLPGLVSVLTEACAGTAKALIVPAKRGTAIMFPAAEKGKPEWRTWHALCGLGAVVAEKGKDASINERLNWNTSRKKKTGD